MFTEQTVKWEGEKRTEDRSDRSTLALCLKQKKEKKVSDWGEEMKRRGKMKTEQMKTEE